MNKNEDKALRVTIEALFDAAEEDAATGGPDALRHIYPNVKIVTTQGVQDVSPDRIEALSMALLDAQFGTQ